MRCRYALPFGQGRNYDDNEVTRADQIRTAFNSPFRPFILATTSVGQEGLDFHQYCHAIYHWNLPSNPVDLEQREGRIHRYKGHVIRKNLAEHYGLSALAEEIQPLSDPWAYLFCRAERLEDSDLIPYWIYEKGKSKIERHIPALTLSREWEQLENLKRALVVYRMVFGQPRQEDLLDFLQSKLPSGVRIENVLRYRVDLTPR
jgi:superfamily II DNA/RNA helicase